MLQRIGLSLMLVLGILSNSIAIAANITGSQSEEAITSRLQPPGLPSIASSGASEVSTAPVVAAHPGKKIYDMSCTACHSIGVAGAPKKGDKAAWEIRMKKGITTLLKHIREGYNAMPAGGACPQCSDEDYKHSIEYMIGKDKI
jgi:cytochrome c5